MNENNIPQNQSFLLLKNPRKSNNLGPILRCASAFGITTIVLVGYEKCSVEGSHGASKHLSMVAFPTSDQAVTFLKSTCGCISIIGIMGPGPNAYKSTAVEINCDGDRMIIKSDINASQQPDIGSDYVPSKSTACRSIPVFEHPFSTEGNTCFVVDKDRRGGLPIALATHCSSFIHIPHFSLTGHDHLLDCQSCLSIALHEFTEYARYRERNFQGNKFDVLPLRRHDARSIEERLVRVMEKQQIEKEAAAEHGNWPQLVFEQIAHDGDY